MALRADVKGNIQFAVDTQRRMAAALVGAILGVFLLYGVGFAAPAMIHNAAHDSRHAFTFPCH